MGIALLCLYAGLLLHVSRAARKAEDRAASFFVNSRASSSLGIAFSLVVSCVGASATMGMAGQAFALGTPAFWWLGSGAVGLVLLAVLLAGKVRESDCYTMPEMVENLLGRRARTLVSVIIVVAWMAILAAQYAAMSRLLFAMTGLSEMWCLGVSFALIVFHTMGGQAVVIRTDRLQFYIMMGGLGLLLFWLGRVNPGWSAAVRLEAVNEHFQARELVRYVFIIGGNYLVCPMLFGRFLSASDAGSARRGGLLAGAGLALSSCLIVAVGLACRGLLPVGTAQDAVLTAAVDTALPTWAAMLVFLALISAVVSSADSCLVTAATVLSYDLLGSDRRGVCHVCVVALGLIGLGITFMDRNILEFLFMAYDVYVAGVVMPVFTALLSRRVLRRPWLVLAAIACGGALGALSALWGNPVFSYAGMALSTLLTLAAYYGSGRERNTA